MDEISWAEVIGSIGLPLLMAAGLFVLVAVALVALVRTRQNCRRLAEKQ
jgi:hypothetical protein